MIAAAAAIAAFFKFKIVGSIIIIACWPVPERTKLLKELSYHGVRATFSCDLDILEKALIGNKNHQGVVYMNIGDDCHIDINKVNPQYFSIWYKWLIIDDEIPATLNKVRYDADIAILKIPEIMENGNGNNGILINSTTSRTLPEKLSNDTTALPQAVWIFNDVYMHLREPASIHPWAFWSMTNGFQIPYERERQLRRRNLKKYPLRISTPMGHFAEGLYNGSFHEYLLDNRKPEQDSAIRCGYGGALLLMESLNATGVLLATHFWVTKDDNRSMYYMLTESRAELGGGILRPMNERVRLFDYVLPLWPLRVGFTYLAERESSTNMFVEPFAPGVWWACLVTGLMLVVVQRLTAKAPLEKDGAVNNVLATLLQQDASAVPEGASGRWTFTVLSLWAMLLHAYYTSAIVSALMSAGPSGPDSLQALGDSKYAIASEDIDYFRYLMFDRNSNWTELEYLKKKLTPIFYQPVEMGAELVRQGSTAYHTEFNHIYTHMKSFSDDQVCKLSYVDTIPETVTWLVTSKHSQFTDVLRSSSFWLHETGLAKRLVSKWRMKPAPCRASLLAERVRFGDVAPLVGVASLGVLTSLVLLALEVMVARKWRKNSGTSVSTA